MKACSHFDVEIYHAKLASVAVAIGNPLFCHPPLLTHYFAALDHPCSSTLVEAIANLSLVTADPFQADKFAIEQRKDWMSVATGSVDQLVVPMDEHY